MTPIGMTTHATREVKPISPKEAAARKKTSIHPTMIAVVNDALVREYGDGRYTIRIKQKDIVAEFLKREPGYTAQMLHAEGHLDFEAAFRENGWTVNYDKPGYNETYDAVFEFKAKK